MKTLLISAILSAPVALAGQAPPNPQNLYEAGSYEQAVNAIASQGEQVPPASLYLAGQSFLRLNRHDEARAQFAKLASGGDPTSWSLVGESATAFLDGNSGLAIEKAKQAVAMAPDQFHPNYQLGLAYSAADQSEPAAASLAKAATIDPSFAYAHYYAGLAYSKLKQLDRMGTHLEYFLKLAPKAPERPAVESLMRSLRGR
jgi:tetratricopeptide (TPR) repeat protein